MVCGFHAIGQGVQHPDSKYIFSDTLNPVQYKNFYLLTLLQQDPVLRTLIQEDAELSTIFKGKVSRISDALKNCPNDIACLSTVFKFTEEEITTVSNRLIILFSANKDLNLMLNKQLIPSGCYQRYAALKPSEMLVKAWEQDAKALNFTIGVYVDAAKPNYPNIDSISFDVKDRSYPELVRTNAVLSLDIRHSMFFEPTLKFAVIALDINDRNDAGDYEPMRTTVNKLSLDAIKKTDFSSYKYSLILVPGEGPEDTKTELSPGGKLRCRLAVAEYHKGIAPFIMVSGGRVHPFKTKYSEAYEMKKYLMNALQVPESAIIMEPHARHTTTNMRNAARIMFRYGIPMDKVALSVTAKSQSMYISGALLSRSVKELGYEPFRLGKRLSDFSLEFYPNATSLQIDFDEPMDP